MLVSTVTTAEVDLPGDPTLSLEGDDAIDRTDWISHQLAAIVHYSGRMHSWMTGEGYVITTSTRTGDAMTYDVAVTLNVAADAPADDEIRLAIAAAVRLRLQQYDIADDDVTLLTTAIRAE